MKKRVQINDIPYLYVDPYIIDGEIEEISQKILNIKTDLEKAYIKRKEDIEKSNKKDKIPAFTPFKDYQYINLKLEKDWDGGIDINIEVFRDETDEEYAQRLEAEEKRKQSIKSANQKRKETIEKRERELYESLKKKYEK